MKKAGIQYPVSGGRLLLESALWFASSDVCQPMVIARATIRVRIYFIMAVYTPPAVHNGSGLCIRLLMANGFTGG